jgi:lactoylglutathione lyase
VACYLPWPPDRPPAAARPRRRANVRLLATSNEEGDRGVITDLGHTAFAVHDMDASLAFYRLLGLEESFRLNREDGSLMLIYLHISGDRFLELFPNGPAPDAPRSHSFRHICLVTDDIAGMVAHLRASGVTIDRDVTEGLDTNLQAWVKDPDGNAIEFMQLSEQSPQRRTARGEPVTIG